MKLEPWFKIQIWGPKDDPRLGPLIDNLRSLASTVELVVSTLANNSKDITMIKEFVEQLKTDLASNHDAVESIRMLVDGLVSRVDALAADRPTDTELQELSQTLHAQTDALVEKTVEGTPHEG